MRASVAVGLLFAAVCAFGQGGGPLPDRTPPPRLQWQRMQSRDGKFSILMPGKASFKNETLTAKNGRPVLYATYTVDLGRSAFMASTSDYDNETRISLGGAIDGVLSSWTSPQNLKRKTTKLFGFPARTVEFNSESYRVIVHAFVVGRRLYQLGFVEFRDDFLRGHADTFLNSFALR